MHLDSGASEIEGICFVKTLGVYNIPIFVVCISHIAACITGICMHVFLIQLCFTKG